jgi:hypothetical protein
MWNVVFRGVTPCSSEKDLCFGGIYRPYLQGQIVSQARNQQEEALQPRRQYSLIVTSVRISDPA